MLLTYDHYPMLLFVSYNMQNAPDQFPFQTDCRHALDYLKETGLLDELFVYIGIKNSSEKESKHKNYLVADSCFEAIESDEDFRKKKTSDFFRADIKPGTGVICFKGGQQYVYMLLDKDETKKLRNLDGRYIAVAMFKQNTFLGLEEALITDEETRLLPTGFYSAPFGPSCFLDVLIVFLSYINTKQNLRIVDKAINKTTEVVYLVE